MKTGPNPKGFFLLAGVMFVIGLGVVYTGYGGVGEQQAKYEAAKKDKKDPKTVQAQFEQSQKELVDLQVKLNHLEQGVPAQAYLPTLLKEIEAVGLQQGIVVAGVRPVPPKVDPTKKPVKKPYEEMDIEVRGHGKFADVLRFVRALNTFPKIVAARQIQMDPKGALGKPGEFTGLDVTVLIRAYMFKEADKPQVATKVTAINVPAAKAVRHEG